MKEGINIAISNYRRDIRSEEEFARDILKGTNAERTILNWYVKHVENISGISLIVEDNGCDNTGRILDDRKVTTQADYKVNGYKVEIKFNNKMLRMFRFKEDQLKSYLRQGAYILWVNGFETNEPLFTVIQPETLREIYNNQTPISFEKWGGKLCYELETKDFQWEKFNLHNNVNVS